MKKLFFILLSAATLNSCVSKKIYNELEDKYSNLKRENRELKDATDNLDTENKQLSTDLNSTSDQLDKATTELERLKEQYNTAKTNLENLKASYEALEKNSSKSIAENAKKNRALLQQLEEKEQALLEESNRLKKLKETLENKSQRVAELEAALAAKDAKMNSLKESISKALTNFEGKGLTVEQRNGKVYVSMENKLLFKSGSWSVGSEGKQAVKQLGTVLAENPEIAILIEGHTDNVPYNGSGQLKNNWDLSTKRATAIVTILRENASINPENLTAAGRGEFAPIVSNETSENRAKNRRIEVILTPKLDEISKLLNDI